MRPSRLTTKKNPSRAWTGRRMGEVNGNPIVCVDCEEKSLSVWLCVYCSPLAAWAPVPLSPPPPGYWKRCRSSEPHHLEREELLSLSGGNKHTDMLNVSNHIKQLYCCNNYAVVLKSRNANNPDKIRHCVFHPSTVETGLKVSRTCWNTDICYSLKYIYIYIQTCDQTLVQV